MKRESNYDLLRVISTIAVISIHVSSIYLDAATNKIPLGGLYLNNIYISSLYESLSRFAVPCFVMLSGAFHLSDDQNSNYSIFYHKIIKNIGIPTLVFSILYFFYSEMDAFLCVKVLQRSYSTLVTPIKAFLIGEPYGHMWYLYMMIGVYLLTPLIIKFKKDIGEKKFEKIAWVFLFLACISKWTSQHILHWDIGQSFCYLGYFMVGYVLRKKIIDKKDNIMGLILIGLGICTLVVISFLRYYHTIRCILGNKMQYKWGGPYSPLVLIAAVFIFAGISFMSIKTDFTKISSNTFYIYLFHGFILDIVRKGIKAMFSTNGDSRIIIPATITMVFVISAVYSMGYKKLWKKIEQRYDVSNKICEFILGGGIRVNSFVLFCVEELR